MDKIDKLIKQLETKIDTNERKVEKLVQNIREEHKKKLKFKNKLFELCKKLSEAKICPKDLNIKIKICNVKIKCSEYNIFLYCWKEWINAS